MVEGGAVEVPEEDIAEGLVVAHEGIRELIEIQKEFLKDVSVPKMEWTPVEIPAELRARVEELAEERVRESLNLKDKTERNQALATLREDIKAALAEEFPEQGDRCRDLEIEKRVMRQRS